MTDLLDEVWVEKVLDEYHGSGLHGLRWAGGSTGPPEVSPTVPLLYWNSRGKTRWWSRRCSNAMPKLRRVRMLP